MKYTKAQFEKWDQECSNGFRMDLNHLFMWDEKQAEVWLTLSDDEDGMKLRAKIYWREANRGNGYVPALHLSLWKPTGINDGLCSSGLGYTIELDNHPVSRRTWKALASYTARWPGHKIMKEAQAHMPELKNPFIFATAI